MGHAEARCTWAMASERWRMCAVPFSGEAFDDLLPGPSAVPGSVNQYTLHTHRCVLPHGFFAAFQTVVVGCLRFSSCSGTHGALCPLIFGQVQWLLPG